MDFKDIKGWVLRGLPYQRRSPLDWIVPSAIGAGVGVACGVGIGLLLAPRPGPETRQRLRAGAESLRDKAKELAEQTRAQAERSLEPKSGERHRMNAR